MAGSTTSLTIARVRTLAFLGLDIAEVDVEVQIASGLPSFAIVGLPDKAVAESRERVRAALGAMGLALPPRRIIVNLAPADLAKEGSHFDLPIALGVLIVMGVLPVDTVERHLVLGELALDGAHPCRRRRAAGGGGRGRARARPDLPGGLRRRGGLAQGPGRDPGRPQPAGPDQPCPRHAAAGPARARHGRGRRALSRPARRQGPGDRQAGARDRRRRRPQPDAGRARPVPASRCWPPG